MVEFMWRAEDEKAECFWWTAASIAFLALFMDPVVRSPDGMEMLRITASWLGEEVQVGDPSFWPPLWSALNVPGVLLGRPVVFASWLNMMLWGAVAWPLFSAVKMIGGRSSARLAVALYLALPALADYTPILDARALGTFITTGFAAAAVGSSRTGRTGWMVGWAAVAPFARPEGVLLGGIAVLIVGWLRREYRSILIAAALVFMPKALFQGSVRGLSGHEQLFGPWYSTWVTSDILSLFGPASVPTEFRRFAIAALESGVVTFRPTGDDVLGVIAAIPGGLLSGVVAIAGGVGVVGLLAAGAGLMRTSRPGHRLLTLAAVAGPFLVIAAAPMARDQAGPLSNFLFLMPTLVGLISLGARAIPSGRWAGWALGALIVAETALSPLRAPPPYFIEGSEAATLATTMLSQQPPASGTVATDFSGRDVVMGAGLEVVALGPPWMGPIPDHVDGILLSSVGASGEDAGRTLSLLEDPAWRVSWVVGDGEIATSKGLQPELPRRDRGWYALLIRASPSP